jgi:hypothetical protein
MKQEIFKFKVFILDFMNNFSNFGRYCKFQADVSIVIFRSQTPFGKMIPGKKLLENGARRSQGSSRKGQCQYQPIATTSNPIQS